MRHTLIPGAVLACAAGLAAQAADGSMLGELRSGQAVRRDTAAAVVRHTWDTLPPEFVDAIVAEPELGRALAGELAIAPRPSFEPLAERVLRDERIVGDDRCLWLAARGRPLSMVEARLVLDVLASGASGDGCRAALALVTPKVADDFVATLHQRLMPGDVRIEVFVPWLDRLSDRGRARLLALVLTLSSETAAALCQYLVDHAPEVYAQRAAAALDAPGPLDEFWLQRAAPLLDRPARVERLLRLLADEATAPSMQRSAFLALAFAGVVDDRLLDWAEFRGGDTWALRTVLDRGVEAIPPARLVTWLRSPGEISQLTVAALGRRPVLEPELARELLAPIESVGTVVGLWCERAAVVLAQRADPQALAAAWPLLRTAPDFVSLAAALARRRAEDVREVLLEELDEPAAAGVDEAARNLQIAAVRLALVAIGERGQLAPLVAQSPHLPPPFVRRCTALDAPLDADLARSLIAAARQADHDLAVELLAWAARCPAPTLAPLWLDVQRAYADSLDVQEIALRALCAGGRRAQLVADLRTAIASGEWDELRDALRFEVVATLPSPPAAEDLELLAELVLLAPLADPVGEAERARRWPDGTRGFPIAAAIAQALRGADPSVVGAAFAKVAVEWREHPQREALARQGLLVLWRSLEADPAVQRAVGAATADCFLALRGDVGAGPAAWFAMLQRQAAGDPAAAAGFARTAAEHLLLRPEARRDARLFLGERDPGAGIDPWAALSAAPHALAAEAALAAGDRAAAATHFAAALDRTGHDAAMRAKIESHMETLR